VHNVFPIPLGVPIDDRGTGGHTVSDHHRLEEFPLLPGVQVSEDAQVPTQVFINLRVQDQRWGHSVSERRDAGIPGIAVLHGPAILMNKSRGYLSFPPAVVPPDIDLVAGCFHALTPCAFTALLPAPGRW